MVSKTLGCFYFKTQLFQPPKYKCVGTKLKLCQPLRTSDICTEGTERNNKAASGEPENKACHSSQQVSQVSMATRLRAAVENGSSVPTPHSRRVKGPSEV